MLNLFQLLYILCSLLFKLLKSGGISSIIDPVFKFRQCEENLRILEIEQIKSVPYTPISHPFVEQLIRTIREELLNHVFFLNASDLRKKLDSYKGFFNQYRAHSGIDAMTPENKGTSNKKVLDLGNYKWEKHLKGLVQLPAAA